MIGQENLNVNQSKEKKANLNFPTVQKNDSKDESSSKALNKTKNSSDDKTPHSNENKKYIQPTIAKIEIAEEIYCIDEELEESDYPMSFDEKSKALYNYNLKDVMKKRNYDKTKN